MRKICHLLILAAATAGLMLIASTGCMSVNSTTSDANTARTNRYDVGKPVYRTDTPTLKELCGVYRSQDRHYHDSAITIFENGDFVWHSRTDTVQIFRGQIYDLNGDGFYVHLSDNSGDAFAFRFSPDKRSFFSTDPYGQTVEEYRR